MKRAQLIALALCQLIVFSAATALKKQGETGEGEAVKRAPAEKLQGVRRQSNICVNITSPDQCHRSGTNQRSSTIKDAEDTSACPPCIHPEINFPQFIPIPPSFKSNLKFDVVQPSYDFFGIESPTGWYASWPTSTRMTILRKTELRNFFLNCETENLFGKDQLTSINFCFDHVCTELKNRQKKKMKKWDRYGRYHEVTLSFSPSFGGSVKYGIAEARHQWADFSTIFYCSVKNRWSILSSNHLEIIDLRNRIPNRAIYSKEEMTVPMNGPKTFHCTPNGLTPRRPSEPLSFVRWFYCSTPFYRRYCGSSLKYIRNLVLKEDGKWPAQVTRNGDLFIPFFTRNAIHALQNRTLECTVEDKITFQTGNYLNITEDAAPNEIRNLKMLMPRQSEKLIIYDSNATNRDYPCNFEAGPGTFHVTWKFKPRKGGSMTTIGNKFLNGVNFQSYENPTYSIRFKGPFNENTSGSYICNVVWTPASGDRQQSASGSFEVKVMFFPKASPEMVPLKYVVDGNDGVVKCLFSGPSVKPSLEINGVRIHLFSKKATEEKVKEVNDAYKTVLSTLDVKVRPVDPAAGDVLTYTAKKMEYRNEKSGLSSTHYVSCFGSNRAGILRWNTLLKVVPKPKMIAGKIPSIHHCNNCKKVYPLTFPCQVENESDIKQKGVVLDQYWLLGNIRIANMVAVPDSKAAKYLSINSDKSLTIGEVDDEDFKRQLNYWGKVECVVTLGYPRSVTKLPTEVKTSGDERGLFFISSLTSMRKKLISRIAL